MNEFETYPFNDLCRSKDCGYFSNGKLEVDTFLCQKYDHP